MQHDHATVPLTVHADWNYERSPGKRHYLVKARRGRRVVGLAHGWFAPNACFVLEKIEIDQRHRSQGHGSAIIQQLREHARMHGCSRFVFSSVRQDNVDAIRLYESMSARPQPIGCDRNDTCEYVLSPP